MTRFDRFVDIIAGAVESGCFRVICLLIACPAAVYLGARMLAAIH